MQSYSLMRPGRGQDSGICCTPKIPAPPKSPTVVECPHFQVKQIWISPAGVLPDHRLISA